MESKHKAESERTIPSGLGSDVPITQGDQVAQYRMPTKEDPLHMEFVWEGRLYEGTAYYVGEVEGKE